MHSRIEALRARMHAEEAAAKSVKAVAPKPVKIAKPGRVPKPRAQKPAPSKPAPVAQGEVDISPLDTMNLIDDVVNKMTPEELRDPANVIRVFNLLVLDEIIRYKKRNFFDHMSDRILDTIIELQKATNPKMARILCHAAVDALECSSLNDGEADGGAMRRLAEIERAIEKGGVR